MLACAPAHAQQELQCAVADAGDRLDKALFADLDAGDSKTIQFEAGQFAAQLGEKPSATMSGGVLVRQGERLAGAESANFNAETMALHLEDGVRYEDPTTRINSDSAEFSYSSGRIRFEGADFTLSRG